MFLFRLTKEFKDYKYAVRKEAKDLRNLNFRRNKNNRAIVCIETKPIKNVIPGLPEYKLKNNWK